ncbi:hypothetical protein ACU686_02715 [Yinghuangia aomiensis]
MARTTPAKLAACAVLAAVPDGGRRMQRRRRGQERQGTRRLGEQGVHGRGHRQDRRVAGRARGHGERREGPRRRTRSRRGWRRTSPSLAEADTALANTLDRAGDPKVKNGGAQRAAVSAELRAAATGWMSLRSAFESLPTTDQKTFAEALKALDPEITKYGTSTRTALENLHRGDLGKALGKVPGCAATVPSPAAPAPSDGASSPAPGQAAPAGGASGSPAASGSASPSGSTVRPRRAARRRRRAPGRPRRPDRRAPRPEPA